jgi:hypothetical protein
MIPFSPLKALLLVSTVFLVGCEEEQVLYETKSPNPIAAPKQTVPLAHPATSPVASVAVIDVAVAGELPGLTLTLPDGWVRQTPTSPMRTLQYQIPALEDGEPGEFIVFYFGPQGGGPVEDNLKRWAEQIQRPDAVPPLQYATLDTLEVNGLTLSRLYSEGMYSAMTSINEPPEPKNDWGLMGVVVEGGPQGPVYLKITGPREMFSEKKEKIDELLGSIKPMETENEE